MCRLSKSPKSGTDQVLYEQHHSNTNADDLSLLSQQPQFLLASAPQVVRLFSLKDVLLNSDLLTEEEATEVHRSFDFPGSRHYKIVDCGCEWMHMVTNMKASLTLLHHQRGGGLEAGHFW